jgi:osmotically-inducible protein OsmY
MGSSDEYRRNRSGYSNRDEYSSNRGGGEYGRGGREGYWGGGWENEHDERSRYGNPMGGSGFERGYNQSRNDYSQRSNYPSGYRSGENYSGGRDYDYDRDRYGRSSERYGNERYSNQGYGNEDRGWWDRASDAVASFFGDEDAERRRRMDEQRAHRRGKGPKNYRRSDERIKEDVNDRLNDDYYIDASDVEVAVENSEVTLTGSVKSRSDKRRVEDIAESVSGVTNVENRLRVKQYDYSTGGSTSITDTSSTPGTTTSSAAAGGGTSTTARGRTTGT